MNKMFTRVLALVAVLCIVVSATPMAFAAENDTNTAFTVFQSTQSTLAPGITASTNYAYATSDGAQFVYYVSTADIDSEYVELHTTFSDGRIDNTGMAKMTDQVKALTAIYTNPEEEYYTPYFTPVAGVNADAFNMSTGVPSGAFVMESVVKSGPNNRAWFGVFADGTAVCGANNTDWDAAIEAHGAPMEAVGGFQLIMKDGETVAHASTAYCGDSRYPRSLVGVTADNKVVIASVDGNQPPFSVGANYDECFAIMKAQGCVNAVCLDGGGSATFVQRAEGSNEVVVWNRPSDGAARAVSSGLLFASTTPPSDVFDRAVLTAENEYVTPYSTVNVTATGVSPAGTAAEIPENAMWQLADSAMGIVENGVFVSSGAVGEVVVQLTVDGEVVGETTINVVIPDLTFDSSDMIVPYDKTFTLKVSGTTNGGLNKVLLKDSDLVFELSNPAMGTINGTSYTTCSAESGMTGGTITVKCAYDAAKTATATVTFGKASVIAEDFEDGSATDWSAKSGYAKSGNHLTFGRFESYDYGIVTAETGKVRNGNYAMKLFADFSTGTAAGYKSIKYSFPAIDLTGATTFGMWMYLAPQDVHYLEFDIGGYEYYIEDDANVTEEGWYYITAPAATVGSSVSTFTIYMTDPDRNYPNTFSDFTIYVDDLTIDYSNATEDREIPTFSKVTVLPTVDAEYEMDGQTVTVNTVTVKAYAAENFTGNYTGLDFDSARVCVDGVELKSGFTCDENGVITVSDIALADGVHTFRFEIDDKAGNTGFVTRQIVVNTDDSDIKLVRRSSTALPLAGSVEYLDIVAKNIEKVDELSLTIDLDTLTEWELQGADVAYGFTMTYSVEDRSHTATINIKKTGECELTGEAVLVALPVRVWATDSYLNQTYIDANAVTNNPSANEKLFVKTPAAMWKTDGVRIVRMEIELESAVVSYADGSTSTFAGKEIIIITENNRYRTEGYYNAEGVYVTGSVEFCEQEKISTHVHVAGEAQNKAATCTEAGYTDRIFCVGCECGAMKYLSTATADVVCDDHAEGCNSVIDWGTVIPATGHTYAFVDGVLKCACGDLFNGIYTDGKTYVDGVVIADGWNGDSYYVDGVKCVGLQEIDGYYYDFGKDGLCANKVRLNGFYYNEDAAAYMYFSGGLKITTQISVYPTMYYFDENGYAISGEKTVCGYNVTFSEYGEFVSAEDANIVDAGFEGNNIEYVVTADGTLYVDGKGAIGDFTSNGIYAPWFVMNRSEIFALVIGNEITEIGEYAFYNNAYLKNVTFEEGCTLKTIGKGAFASCHRLSEITLPASVEVIEELAFFKTGAMKTVNIEDGTKLHTIGREAFNQTHVLEKIFIPATVTNIGDNLFKKGNANIVMQVVEESEAYFYAIENNIAYELVEGTVAPTYSGNLTDTITWGLYPNGTLVINGIGPMPNFTSHGQQPWAAQRHLIKHIVIGKDITTVSNYSFAYAHNVESVTFEEGSKLVSVGVLSFRDMPDLTEVVLPETATSLATYAFGDCDSLVNVYIPQNMKSMHSKAFVNSANVVLSVAEGTYAQQYAETYGIAYTVRKFVPAVVASGICGTNATWTFTSDGVMTIGGSGAMTDYADAKSMPWYSYLKQIKHIVIGKDITTVGNYAFAYAYNTQSVTFEEGSKLEKIGALGFFYMMHTTEIILPETVTSLSSNAFGYCAKLENVYIPQEMASMFSNAFRNSMLVVLNVAEGSYAHEFAEKYSIAYTVRPYVAEVVAFGTCGDNATWVLTSDGVMTIGGSGAMADFADAKSMPWYSYLRQVKHIVIGKDITTVGNYSFAYAHNVESVTFEEGSKLEKIGVLSFFYMLYVTEVDIPDTVTYIGSNAFGYCTKLATVKMPTVDSLYVHGAAFRNTPYAQA